MARRRIPIGQHGEIRLRSRRPRRAAKTRTVLDATCATTTASSAKCPRPDRHARLRVTRCSKTFAFGSRPPPVQAQTASRRTRRFGSSPTNGSKSAEPATSPRARCGSTSRRRGFTSSSTWEGG